MVNEKENSLSNLTKNVRVRVCGLLFEDEKILLLKHTSLGELGYLWSPPGGGVNFGESLEKALIREFKEETNLAIEIIEYLFTNEMINDRHHAIELFFLVRQVSGELKLGSDPEFDEKNQILTDAVFFSTEELNNLPENAIHNAFFATKTRDKIAEIKGLISFKH